MYAKLQPSVSKAPQVTVVVPSFNQGHFLEEALRSIAEQNVATEIIVMDGGSTDGSLAVLERWASRLTYWHSGADSGQAAAINEGIRHGTAPYVAWLNSDDMLAPGGLSFLIQALESNFDAPAAYGKVNNLNSKGIQSAIWVQPFTERALSLRCIISQPGTLIRRIAWETVGGLNPSLSFAMDYDLWWRLYLRFGPPVYVPQLTAINRLHRGTKTRNNRAAHYAEAMAVVGRYHGRVPLKWWLAQPYAIWWKALAVNLGLPP